MAPWFDTADHCLCFLRRCGDEVGIAGVEERGSAGGWRVRFRIAVPDGEPVSLSLRMVGDTVRITTHQVLRGNVNPGVFATYNRVNQAPWFGRIYHSTDLGDVDLSLGVPAPEAPTDKFAFAPLLQLMLRSTSAVRTRQLPPDPGFVGEAGDAVFSRVARRLADAGGPVNTLYGGGLIWTELVHQENAMRLEAFMVGETTLVIRAVPTPPPMRDSDVLLRRLAEWNRGAPAGAAALAPEVAQIYGCASLIPALVAVDARTLEWVIARALQAALGAVWAASEA